MVMIMMMIIMIIIMIYPAVNPLDGCLHVFLDLGSNRGLQIRKLYEPETFPLAPVLPLYEKYFGRPEDRNLQEICSVGVMMIIIIIMIMVIIMMMMMIMII